MLGGNLPKLDSGDGGLRKASDFGDVFGGVADDSPEGSESGVR